MMDVFYYLIIMLCLMGYHIYLGVRIVLYSNLLTMTMYSFLVSNPPRGKYSAAYLSIELHSCLNSASDDG